VRVRPVERLRVSISGPMHGAIGPAASKKDNLDFRRFSELVRVPFELRNYAVLLSLLRMDPAGARADYRLAKQARALGAMQKWRELAPLIGMLRNRRLATVVEIGTARGGTLWLWCRLADPHALIVSIDLDTEAALRAYGGPQQIVRLLSRDSHSAATRQSLVDILERRSIDLLVIDGDHTYEGVKQDFEMYSPLVPDGGLVLFHDIVRPAHLESCRVDVFWGEIKQQHRYYEIKERSGGRGSEQWGGFGVLVQGSPGR